ncbi:Detected protein of confused Function [Hibiscus syriacus]|uniref:peroxidase n=1 Tax=Hibiscus syriacus TaxID=106335 RepID=A0A6A2WJH1_HIBSY|nr:Detected protein of confused Function [Hibiscus syriacus]
MANAAHARFLSIIMQNHASTARQLPTIQEAPGCDASILIATQPGSKILAEKDAEDNKDLRTEGFDTITRAKTLVESKCPGIVSCADILAISTEILSICTAILEQFTLCSNKTRKIFMFYGPNLSATKIAGGPYYPVKTGRWDGKISMASRIKLGLLASDQGLFLDQRTKPIVQSFGQDKAKFFQAFSAAMDKMGSIGVKRGRRHGEKRKVCSMHM